MHTRPRSHPGTAAPVLPEDSLAYALLTTAQLVADVVAGGTLTESLAKL